MPADNRKHEIHLVSPDEIVDITKIRQNTGQDSIIELANSIKSTGLLQPPAVKKIQDKRYKVIFGHRRISAMKYLCWKAIPVMIIDGDDLPLLSVIENIQREDLTIPDKALAFLDLAGSEKYGPGELANKLGKNKSYISRMVKLGKLIKERPGVSFTKLSISTYWELMDTPELLVMAEDGKWNQQKARKKARELQNIRNKEVMNKDLSNSNKKRVSQNRQIKNQSLDSYEPIRFYDDCFKIQSLTYNFNSSKNSEVVIEKLMDLKLRLDKAIEIVRHLQNTEATDSSAQVGKTIGVLYTDPFELVLDDDELDQR